MFSLTRNSDLGQTYSGMPISFAGINHNVTVTSRPVTSEGFCTQSSRNSATTRASNNLSKQTMAVQFLTIFVKDLYFLNGSRLKPSIQWSCEDQLFRGNFHLDVDVNFQKPKKLL